MTYKLKPMADADFIKFLYRIRRVANKTRMKIVSIADEIVDGNSYYTIITLEPMRKSGGNAQ